MFGNNIDNGNHWDQNTMNHKIHRKTSGVMTTGNALDTHPIIYDIRQNLTVSKPNKDETNGEIKLLLRQKFEIQKMLY